MELHQRGAVFRGNSDTEVLLAAISAWGLERALERITGMFAFALWDAADRSVTLVRDRVGEKPLYYGSTAAGFVFTSDLGALRTLPNWSPEVDRQALCLFLRHNYIPAPHSIYKGISKLPPGHCLKIRVTPDGFSPLEAEPYWSAEAAICDGQRRPMRADPSTIVDEAQELLQTIVSEQMVADVPLGAFLSGGIDSSLVVAVMQSLASSPVRTFSIGFEDPHYDEAPHARAIARHLGTRHTELYVSAQEAQGLIPSLPTIYTEPFADPSQVATCLVARLARSEVTVALSGDGGDELFGGYSRYFWGCGILKRTRHLPKALRRHIGWLLTLPSPARWDAIVGLIQDLLPTKHRFSKPGQKLHKLGLALEAGDARGLYRRLMSHWASPERVVLGGCEPLTPITDPAWLPPLSGCAELMMLLDILTYLPDNNLAKLDRAAMAVSLETRAPLVDHRLVEFAARVPLSMKIQGRTGKLLLRALLERYLPRETFERQKMGFGVPVGAWIRGPLREWAEDLLAPSRLARDGYFDVQQVRDEWQSHLSGRTNGQYRLWSILMFQAWLEQTH
jgi:asparagine synthase (glutamine-hydrolysing)